MLRPLLLLFAVLAALPAGAANITSATCTPSNSTGCANLTIPSPSTTASVTVEVSGTWVATLAFEGSLGGTTFRALVAVPSAGGAYATATTGNGLWQVHTAGSAYVRVRATSYTSGTAVVTMNPSTAPPFTDVVRAVGSDFGDVGVAVAAPDGGLPVTLGAQRVSVEATGPDGDPVAVFGSVTATLTPATIAALGPAPCIQGETRRLPVSGTAIPVPPNLSDGGIGSLANRTDILLVNAGTVGTQTVSCRVDPGDGGVPDCATPGFGLTLQSNGGSASFTARDNQRIRCVACVGSNVPIEYQEESCVR